MGVSQGAYQVQGQKQQLRLSQLQLAVVRMLELPVTELAENVKNEIVDNFALEEGTLKSSNDTDFDGEDCDDADNSNADEYVAPESYCDFDSDDDIPLGALNGGMDSKAQEIPIGATKSFIDDLMEQMVNYDLTNMQATLVEYLICSLDNHGFLTSSAYEIVDDLMITHNIYTDEAAVEEALSILQQFDPPGIAAHDTRECLLLQIDRQLQNANSKSFDTVELLQYARQVIDEHYDLFINNNQDKLMAVLDISSVHLKDVIDTIRKLDIHPGLALCESSSDRVQLAIPDFIIETDTEGEITISLNGGGVPSLHVNQEYAQMAKMMQTSVAKLNRQDKERFDYYRSKLDSARMYIEAIKQRQHTLESTMHAIVSLQRKFFLTQNEDDLQKLILDDVAKKAGVDISTVSRVCNSKYAMVDGVNYPLSFFFKRMRTNGDGEDVDGRKVELTLKQIIDSENKAKPFSDGQLVEELKKMGINISRRTVNKYRDNMGIPVATKRKNI